MLMAALQHQPGGPHRAADTRFGCAARSELQCTRLECRTVIICPASGSFLRKECASWCRGWGWWKKRAAHDAGAAGSSGPALWPRLLAAPRSAFLHVGHRVRVPLLPSGGVTVASVVNHEYRNHIRDWGPPWCFPLSQAGWADTIQGRRQLWARVGFIWGRTVGRCRLGEQGRHRKLLPEMDKG